MKQNFVTIVMIASLGIVSCSRKQSTDNFSTLPTASKQNTKKDKKKEFTRLFVPLDGGSKADCSDPGNDCKVTAYAITFDQSEELAKLNKCIDNGDTKNYFRNENWTILFSELVDEVEILNGIEDGTIKLYRAEDLNSVRHYYILSSAADQSRITSDNEILSWLY